MVPSASLQINSDAALHCKKRPMDTEKLNLKRGDLKTKAEICMKPKHTMFILLAHIVSLELNN